MADRNSLMARSAEAASALSRLSRDGKRILVVTHIDADGLSSGSIAFQSLARKRASVCLRTVPDLDLSTISRLKEDQFDFYLFTDLASGLIDELSSSLGDAFMVVDHHQLPEKDGGHRNVLNAWDFGYDGGVEACSSSMAYALSVAMDETNRDLSAIAIIGALGDRQDGGESRSLTGLNKAALDDAVSMGLASVAKDFVFHGRETRPVHEAIALTYSPFIEGLSGAKDSSLAALSKAGFKLKDRGRWRTLSELSNEEKQRLMDVLASFLASSGRGSDIVSELIGNVYTLQLEDSLTPLRDGREFATLLNACGRMDRTDVGIAICLGDREGALREALKLVGEYRGKLNKAIQTLQAERERVADNGEVMLVTGDEFIDERMTGSISSLLASSDKFRSRLVIVSARSGDSDLKYSSRVGDAYPKKVNLGLIMREAAEEVGGVGGGHSMAAGAKVPVSRRDEFAKAVMKRVSQ